MQRLFWLLVGLELCGADWTVTSGSCRVDDDGCLQSPRYPSNYRNSQTCEIQVQSGNAKKISVDSFDTEAGYDILQVNGQQFSGNIAPHDIVPSGTIRWSSDYSITAGGWRLCLQVRLWT